ncbi:DinB family protein [Mucilaginibacter yixingensis]|uniref:DinB family protein n=1 Tax=Mucilaginibacter yixingensis TaxID=1295612 RepID=A0A2T5JE37_9SPHI|nr:DinB family protein [Mucilaginibacter yixingensis]PTR00031.1 DinB family protein [Mucilaginibacter yixingensis]
MEKQLAEQLKQTRDGFLAALDIFSPEEFNTVPFEGSWTPAQVAQHILLSVTGTGQLVTGPTQAADRDWQQNAAQLASIFLNFEIKMQGPDFVQPDDQPKDQQEIITQLRAGFDKLVTVAANEDLTEICTAGEFPTMGHLSRFELLTFADVHTRRHTHQLQNIATHFA